MDHSFETRIPASYYFLAISLDHLGDCEQANRSYQEFLAPSRCNNEQERSGGSDHEVGGVAKIDQRA